MALRNQKANGASRQEAPKSNRPVYSKKYWTGAGGHVEVAVFEKAVENGQNSFTRHVAILKKSYKDGDEYKETQFLKAEELLIAAHALEEAYRAIQAE